MVLHNLYQPPVIVKLEEGEVAERYLRSSQISSTSECLLLIPEEKGRLFAFKGGEGSTAENSDHNKVLQMPKTFKGSEKVTRFADKRLSMPQYSVAQWRRTPG
jgi:hypothetical protein